MKEKNKQDNRCSSSVNASRAEAVLDNQKISPGASPSAVFAQYKAGVSFKTGLGSRGMYEQNKMNERYLVGDQWYGANCGNDRPLVRHNVIKRIADYKMAVVGASAVTVNYSADGVPSTLDVKERVQTIRKILASGGPDMMDGYKQMADWDSITASGPQNSKGFALPSDEEVNLVMSAMSDYYRVTAERVKFDDVRERALRNAYCAGTGIVYTYWDERIKTGLYADETRKAAVTGDIAVEVLDIENVYFGDPNTDDVQEQPYIIISQRRSVAELRREARRFGADKHNVECIVPDTDTSYMAGQISENEPSESSKALVLTKLWKQWDDDGREYKVMAVRVCDGVTVRPEWELGIRLYPLAKFSWERRGNCAYGESEITYLIPNQIAINRMITASVWSVMMMGMPIMMVNGDLIPDEITNDPGQVVRIHGDAGDVATAARYLDPPGFSAQAENNISGLINNTLKQAGANEAALGDIRPDNASAIIAVREAATMPLQMIQNRYNSFCEDIARIWAEFWVTAYGRRMLKIKDENGTWYFPFDGERYRELLISTRADVVASALWSESQSVSTLDNLLNRNVINAKQYLTRLPKGAIPDITGLIREIDV